MEITVEISYFPLSEEYRQVVIEFIDAIKGNEGVKVEPGIMSSTITGTFDDIMSLLHAEMKPFMEKYPSVFLLKFSNSCFVC